MSAADPTQTRNFPSQPSLQSISGRPVDRRFAIEVKSIYYHPIPDGVSCAILLDVSFDLDKEDKFSHAVVPLSARRSTEASGTSNEEDLCKIDISTTLPRRKQYSPIAKTVVEEKRTLVPNIKFDGFGIGIEVGGVGVTQDETVTTVHTISLEAVLKSREDLPTYLKWKFSDDSRKGIFYPSKLRLLVFVEKETDTPMSYFPFELRLEPQLAVNIYGFFGTVRRQVKTFVNENFRQQHEGWRFTIRGQYKPQDALKAKEDAEEGKWEDSGIGLPVAVRSWIEAHRNV